MKLTELPVTLEVNNMKNIIIDLEFTGLDNSFIKDNEIVQLKIMDVETQKTACINYRTKKDSGAGAYLIHGIKNNSDFHSFSKFEFTDVLKYHLLIALTENIEECTFWGYSTDADMAMLKKYSINIEIIDIRERLQRSEYETRLATEGISLEAAYYIATGMLPKTINHGDETELLLIYELYKVCQILIPNKYLTVMPHGHCAGMPLKQYVVDYRRAADGYRFNNSDVLSDSLSFAIECAEEEMNEDEYPFDE